MFCAGTATRGSERESFVHFGGRSSVQWRRRRPARLRCNCLARPLEGRPSLRAAEGNKRNSTRANRHQCHKIRPLQWPLCRRLFAGSRARNVRLPPKESPTRRTLLSSGRLKLAGRRTRGGRLNCLMQAEHVGGEQIIRLMSARRQRSERGEAPNYCAGVRVYARAYRLATVGRLFPRLFRLLCWRLRPLRNQSRHPDTRPRRRGRVSARNNGNAMIKIKEGSVLCSRAPIK